MEPNDFYKLTIGQKIWYKGIEKTITSMAESVRTPDKDPLYYNEICFRGLEFGDWDDICADCSLTAPKKKKTITLTRFIALVEPDDFRQTEWRTDHNPSMYRKIVHTETKTVEVDDNAE